MKPRLALALVTVVASLFAAKVVEAQDGDYPSDDDVNRIARLLYCPVCPNTPLDVCETQACQDWRAQIRDELTAGWTEQQILDYFVAQYGERVLAEPQRRGFTSLVWLLPVIAVGLGAVVTFQVLRSWRAGRVGQAGATAQAGGSSSAIPAQILEQIERKLDEIY